MTILPYPQWAYIACGVLLVLIGLMVLGELLGSRRGDRAHSKRSRHELPPDELERLLRGGR